MLRKNNIEKTLLEMGKHSFMTEDGWTIVEADHPVHFRIDPTPAFVRKSTQGSTRLCVVAQAFRDALGAPGLDFVVGAGITKILHIDAKIEVHFATPRILAKHLKIYDKKGDWQLPPDLYRLLPLPKSWRIKSVRKAQIEKAKLRRLAKKNGKRNVVVVNNQAERRKAMILKETKTTTRKTRATVTRVIVRRSRLKKLGNHTL